MRYVLGSAVACSFAALSMAQTPTRPFAISDALAVADVGSPVLSPDGAWVVYTVSRLDLEDDSSVSNLFRVPFTGGESVALTSSTKSQSNSKPRFSADGRYLGFLSDRDEDESQVFVLDLRGGEPIRVTSLDSGVSDFRWSPDGKQLVVVSRDPDPHAARDDEDGEEDETKPPLVINRLQFKRDGRGYLDERRNHLYVVDIDLDDPDSAARQLTEGPYDDGEPVWSPDGREIAFVSNRTEEPDANDNTDIFLVPASGGEPRRITTNPGADRSPSFNPDGRLIAYLSVLEPELIWYALDHLAVVPADGGTPRVLTGALDRNVRRIAFSPDGEQVLFLLEDSGNQHLARIRADGGGEVERLVTGDIEIGALDVGTGGRVVFTSSRPDLPTEVFAWTSGEPRRLTHTHDELLAGARLAPVETISFQSKDGTEVEGFVTKPADFDPSQRYPTILWIHGGPVSQFATSFNEIWQVFAGAGYVVVSANPRGSSGYGKDFSKAIWADWGNRDYEDVMAAVDYVVDAGYADPDRLGVGGWSYGGILTNYVITKTGRFRAAISGASETNYLACYGTDHYQHEWEKELGLPWENRDLYLKLSPLTYVQNVTTPTLVLCGEHDWNVPLNQSEQLYQSLKRRGIETTLIIYPGQSHGISKPSYQKDRYERYLMWFAAHLGVAKPTEN